MKVYLFGNEDVPEDSLPFKLAGRLKKSIAGVEFVKVLPNEDLPFVTDEPVIIMDTMFGIDKVTVIGDEDMEKLMLSPRTSVHDFDLAFQLKYLKKLGKIGKVIIIGLPGDKGADYLSVQSILRKLVAQDMQGS